MEDETQGRIPAYSTRFEQKTKGEVVWSVGVHLDDKEQLKLDSEALIEWAMVAATKIKKPEMEG